MKKKITVKSEDKYRNYIKKLVEYLRDHTNHHEYMIRFNFCDEAPKEDEDSDTHTIAVIHTDPNYLNIIIHTYPELRATYEEGRYDECGRYMLHEICHVFLEPITRLFMEDFAGFREINARQTVERQTQRIANVIGFGLPKNWYTPEFLEKY